MEELKIVEFDEAVGYEVAELEVGLKDVNQEVYISIQDIDSACSINITEDQAKKIVEHFKTQFSWD